MDISNVKRDFRKLSDEVKLLLKAAETDDQLTTDRARQLLQSLHELTERTVLLKHFLELENTRQSETKPVETPKFESPVEETSVPESPATVNQPKPTPPPAPEVSKSTSRKGLVEDELKKLKVTDLFTAIGINEKYLFSSELFRGSTAEFTDALKELNNAQDWNTAESKLLNLAEKYGWDAENDTVMNFMELVSRRHG